MHWDDSRHFLEKHGFPLHWPFPRRRDAPIENASDRPIGTVSTAAIPKSAGVLRRCHQSATVVIICSNDPYRSDDRGNRGDHPRPPEHYQE
jgi:hypothetical protein